MKKEMPLGRLMAGIVAFAVVLLVAAYALSRMSGPGKARPKPGASASTSGPETQRTAPDSPNRFAPSKSGARAGARQTLTVESSSPVATSHLGKPDTGETDAPPTELQMRVERIKELETYSQRRTKLTELAEELAAKGFHDALDTVKEIEDTRIRNQLLMSVFHYQGARDPEQALAAAFEMRPESAGRHRTRAFYDKDKIYRDMLGATMKGWATTRPIQALDCVGQLPTEYRGQVLSSVYGGWAEVDPTDAILHAESKSIDIRNRVIGDIATSWCRNDPAAAAACVRDLDDIHPGGRQSLLDHVLGRWAETDIKGALDWANAVITDDKQFEDSVLEITRSLSRHAPEQAAEIITMVPELAGMQAGLTHRIADEWSKTHPENAATWSSTLEDVGLRGTAVKLIASNWASKSPDDALSWARDLRDENERAYALSNIAVRQAQAKSENVTGWIRELPSGFVRARTTAGYALGVLRGANDYRNASRVQQQIGNQSVNVEEVRKIVESAAISDAEREELLSLL